MDLSVKLKQRLTKDFVLPIYIFDEPYYDYFKNLYDGFYDITSKENLMKDVISNLLEKDQTENKDQIYFDYAISVNSSLKDIILKSDAYRKMNEFDLNKNKLPIEVSKGNIYVEENLDRPLISVDLNKANFNSFNVFGFKDELGINSYKEFISLVTPFQYFQESRVSRQVIFGDLNPARQQAIQKNIIGKFAQLLIANGMKLSSASSDEIIIDPGKDEKITGHLVNEILKDVPDIYKFFRVEDFSFTKIDPDANFFFKTSIDLEGNKKEVFKNVPSLYFAQAFKRKFGMPVENNDLLFELDNRLSRFLKPMFPPLENKQKLKV